MMKIPCTSEENDLEILEQQSNAPENLQICSGNSEIDHRQHEKLDLEIDGIPFLIELKAEEFDGSAEQDSANENQILIEKQLGQDFIKFDGESLQPDFLPCQGQERDSEMSIQDLLSPRKILQNTDFGSPAANIFELEAGSDMIIKQFRLCRQQSNDLTSRLRLQKQRIRKQKVDQYLQKKLRRSFFKRTSYHSRKTVAESRLRIKGRFINRQKAQQILGLDLSWLCNKQIKVLLSDHFDS